VNRGTKSGSDLAFELLGFAHDGSVERLCTQKANRRDNNVGLGNLSDLGNLDLGQLQQLLPNLNFPATKDEVLSDLQSNDAPQEVVDQVRNSSKDTFNSADEVLQTVQGKL
jgi:hypothetical protein